LKAAKGTIREQIKEIADLTEKYNYLKGFPERLERTEKELKVTAEDLEDTRGKLEHMTEVAKQRDLEIKSLNKVGLVDLTDRAPFLCTTTAH
jgi:hypothetical protein